MSRRVTHCPRGHALEAPNLVPANVKKGERSCLVCRRAFTAISNLEIRGYVFANRAAAVEHYANLELTRTDKGRDLVAAAALGVQA